MLLHAGGGTVPRLHPELEGAGLDAGAVGAVQGRVVATEEQDTSSRDKVFIQGLSLPCKPIRVEPICFVRVFKTIKIQGKKYSTRVLGQLVGIARRLEKRAGNAARLHPEASVRNAVHTHTHNKDVYLNVRVPYQTLPPLQDFLELLEKNS